MLKKFLENKREILTFISLIFLFVLYSIIIYFVSHCRAKSSLEKEAIKISQSIGEGIQIIEKNKLKVEEIARIKKEQSQKKSNKKKDSSQIEGYTNSTSEPQTSGDIPEIHHAVYTVDGHHTQDLSGENRLSSPGSNPISHSNLELFLTQPFRANIKNINEHFIELDLGLHSRQATIRFKNHCPKQYKYYIGAGFPLTIIFGMRLYNSIGLAFIGGIEYSIYHRRFQDFISVALVFHF